MYGSRIKQFVHTDKENKKELYGENIQNII